MYKIGDIKNIYKKKENAPLKVNNYIKDIDFIWK